MGQPLKQDDYKVLTQRSRGRFKPAPNLSIEQVKKVLSNKIAEEVEISLDLENNAVEAPVTSFREDKINIVSLFSGAGGLDLGVELAGLVSEIGAERAFNAFNDSRETYEKVRHESIFNTVYTNDMFVEANQTYRMNNPDSVFQHEMDIRKVVAFPDNQLIIGGFPCPGFSEAGPRLIDDERNFLYLHFIRALMQTQPAFFIAENVKGMLTLGKGEVIKQIIEDFAAAGYTVTAHLVNARDYGVPQMRERVFLVGVHKEKVEKQFGFSYELPAPTHGDWFGVDGESLQPYVTLKDAIGDLEDNPGEYFDGSYSTIYMSRNRKKKWEEQSFTIQASGRQAPQHPGGEPMVKLGANHWEFQGQKNRRLSINEIKRIQTFPDWYEFSGGKSNISRNAQIDKIYKQIGNAVPVLLARAVVQPIADFYKVNMGKLR